MTEIEARLAKGLLPNSVWIMSNTNLPALIPVINKFVYSLYPGFPVHFLGVVVWSFNTQNERMVTLRFYSDHSLDEYNVILFFKDVEVRFDEDGAVIFCTDKNSNQSPRWTNDGIRNFKLTVKND